jgi:2-keto-3-deoxy-L-rhamnonate aldolase RhmA
MLQDRIRQRLDQGEVAYGIVNLWPDPDLVELAGACGFDFVFIDAEHGALDIRTCAELVRAATSGGMSSLIRVPYGEMDGVYRYLDLGAHGLIFAHINSAATAKAATVACFFPPEGNRGAMSTSRAARYGIPFKPQEYYRMANDGLWVLPIIEDVEGVDHLEEILIVPGIRGFFVGPGDLALSKLHHDRDRESVEVLVDRTIATGVRLGKIVATVAATPEAAEALINKGVRMIVVGANALLKAAYLDYLKAAPRLQKRS